MSGAVGRRIRESARGETCTLRLPDICNFNRETTVLCHADHPDKGMGHKGPDTWAAYGCSACHAVMDDRGHPYWETSPTSRKEFWHDAIRETQRRLITKKIIPG